MKAFIKDAAQALVMATLIGGPMFIYMIFVMKP